MPDATKDAWSTRFSPGGLTLPYPPGVDEGEVPTPISSVKQKEMPSRISNDQPRDLAPRMTPDTLESEERTRILEVGASSSCGGVSPGKQIRGSTASSGCAIGAGR
jgi:hypothetical protein